MKDTAVKFKDHVRKLWKIIAGPHGISVNLFHWIAVLWLGILVLYGLEYTGYNLPDVYEYVTVYHQFILKSLLKFLIALLVCLIMGKLYDILLWKLPHWAMPLIACVISGAVAVLWVYLSKTAPVGDQEQVLGCATELSWGNRFMFEKWAYIGIYQQNAGLMLLEMVLIKIFGPASYLPFQYMVALLVPAGVFSGYKIVGYLSDHDRKAQYYYLLLMICCVPMYGYVPFVYGDVISIITLLGTVWCLLSLFEKFRIYKLPLLAVLAGVTVQLRANTLVPMIGIGIVILVKLLRGNRKHNLLIGLSLLIGLIGIRAGVRAYCQFPEDSKGIPAITYLYMGMNDENGNPGWYDSSGLYIFAEFDHDPEPTKKAAWERMQPYIENFRNNPEYFADFVSRKIVMQWEVPMYQCLEMTGNKFYDSLGSFADSVFSARGIGDYIQQFSKYYQLLIYGGVFCLLIKKRKEKYPIEKYVLLIGAFGGFLFSLIWEAKPRYVFPYFMIMIPYAAMMLSNLSAHFRKKEISHERNGKETFKI